MLCRIVRVLAASESVCVVLLECDHDAEVERRDGKLPSAGDEASCEECEKLEAAAKALGGGAV